MKNAKVVLTCSKMISCLGFCSPKVKECVACNLYWIKISSHNRLKLCVTPNSDTRMILCLLCPSNWEGLARRKHNETSCNKGGNRHLDVFKKTLCFIWNYWNCFLRNIVITLVYDYHVFNTDTPSQLIPSYYNMMERSAACLHEVAKRQHNIRECQAG